MADASVEGRVSAGFLGRQVALWRGGGGGLRLVAYLGACPDSRGLLKPPSAEPAQIVVWFEASRLGWTGVVLALRSGRDGAMSAPAS